MSAISSTAFFRGSVCASRVRKSPVTACFGQFGLACLCSDLAATATPQVQPARAPGARPQSPHLPKLGPKPSNLRPPQRTLSPAGGRAARSHRIRRNAAFSRGSASTPASAGEPGLNSLSLLRRATCSRCPAGLGPPGRARGKSPQHMPRMATLQRTPRAFRACPSREGQQCL